MRATARTIIPALILIFIAVAAAQIGAPTPSTTDIRIVSPKAGAKLDQNSVLVQFQLTNRRAVPAPSPNFQIRVDDQDPVTVSSYEYSVEGLAPGQHRVSVQLVDANNNPVAGARAEVTFTVAAPQPAPASGGAQQSPRSALDDGNPVEETGSFRTASAGSRLPRATSNLPLLSVIGFGVLVGGIASAMRTR